MCDLRQIARVARGIAPVFPGHRHQAARRRAAGARGRRARLHARGGGAGGVRRGLRRPPRHRRARRGRRRRARCSSPSGWTPPHSLAHVIREGTQEERDHYGELFVRFLFEGPRLTGMLHADPHPGNFRILPGARRRPRPAGRPRLRRRRPPRGRHACPPAMGRLMRIALDADQESLVAGLREEGFIKDKIEVDPALVLAYLAPFVEPAAQDRFTFTREWMREQFERVNDPRSEAFTLATQAQPADVLPPHPPHLARRPSACSASSTRPRPSARSSRSRCRGSRGR